MSSSMRIFLVTKSTGGIAEYIRWLVGGLDHRKVSAMVACLSENSEMFAKELCEMPGVYALGYDMNRYKVAPVSDARLCWQLRTLMKSGEFELVHAHGSKAGFLTRIAALGTKLPVLYSPHCFAFHAGAGRVTKFFVVVLERLVAPLTTKYVTVSDGEHELALRYGVGNESQFSVIYTGVDADRFHKLVNVPEMKMSLGIPVDAQVVGSVGRLNAQKSPLDFVRVAAAVLKSKPDVRFVWAGNGPLEDEARAFSIASGIATSIIWLGHRSDIPQLLHIFDCFLLTSRWEGFPLVVLEAMSSGVPVVATDILGTREAILHGQNGWLAPVGDVEALGRICFKFVE